MSPTPKRQRLLSHKADNMLKAATSSHKRSRGDKTNPIIFKTYSQPHLTAASTSLASAKKVACAPSPVEVVYLDGEVIEVIELEEEAIEVIEDNTDTDYIDYEGDCYNLMSLLKTNKVRLHTPSKRRRRELTLEFCPRRRNNIRGEQNQGSEFLFLDWKANR